MAGEDDYSCRENEISTSPLGPLENRSRAEIGGKSHNPALHRRHRTYPEDERQTEEKAKKTRMREPTGKNAKTSQGKTSTYLLDLALNNWELVNIILKTSNSYVILLFF